MHDSIGSGWQQGKPALPLDRAPFSGADLEEVPMGDPLDKLVLVLVLLIVVMVLLIVWRLVRHLERR
jgi:hypothetical protein